MSCKVITAKFYARGKAEGRALVTDKSLCFWGGLDPETGKIIETGHPLEGQDVTGKVLIFPRGHGSSSSSGVLQLFFPFHFMHSRIKAFRKHSLKVNFFY